MSSTITIAAAFDKGSRDSQQDRADFATIKGGHLLVLADGVGGARHGDIAAGIAVDTFVDAARQGEFDDPLDRPDALQRTLMRANESIERHGENYPETQGMATTLVAAIVTERDVEWISVGDSHLYLATAAGLVKLNIDHSAAGLEQHGNGQDPGGAAARPNELRSALNGSEIPLIDQPQTPYSIERANVCLLASDGLDTLPPDRIAAIPFESDLPSAKGIAQALVDAVRSMGREGQDNISILVACNVDQLISAKAQRREAAVIASPMPSSSPLERPAVAVSQPVEIAGEGTAGRGALDAIKEFGKLPWPAATAKATTAAEADRISTSETSQARQAPLRAPADPRPAGRESRGDRGPATAIRRSARDRKPLTGIALGTALVLVVLAVLAAGYSLFGGQLGMLAPLRSVVEGNQNNPAHDLRNWRAQELRAEFDSYAIVPAISPEACYEVCWKQETCGFFTVDKSPRRNSPQPFNCRLFRPEESRDGWWYWRPRTFYFKVQSHNL